METKTNERIWYDNPNLLTSILIGLIAVILILSQSFAVKNNLAVTDILGSLLNYNSIYILTLVYFVALKIKIGKKYFDFLNILLILVYFLISVASLFTVFQSFGISSLISCVLNIVLLFYLTYTFTKETKFYKDLKLDQIPFDEVAQEWYFYAISVLAIILFVADLIVVENMQAVILATLNCVYSILFARYIYLYNNHLERKKKKEVKE